MTPPVKRHAQPVGDRQQDGAAGEVMVIDGGFNATT
jgi:hypothetical protein